MTAPAHESQPGGFPARRLGMNDGALPSRGRRAEIQTGVNRALVYTKVRSGSLLILFRRLFVPVCQAIQYAHGTRPARLSRPMKGELDWLVMRDLEKDHSRC